MDDERPLREALERAQHALQASRQRVEQLEQGAGAREAALRARQAPLEEQLAEARQRFVEQTLAFEERARALTLAWRSEVELREAELQRLRDALEQTAPRHVGDGRCRRCGSLGLIPNLEVWTGMDIAPRPITLIYDPNPEKVFFKKRATSGLTAEVCKACGHAELLAVDWEDLAAAHDDASEG
jgi:hypothetical protein